MALQVSYGDILEIKLFDADKVSGDDPLGMVEIKVSDMAATPRVCSSLNPKP